MADRNIKQLNQGKSKLAKPQHYDLSVMKPFVKFGLSAMGVIGHALVTIVKNIPKPHEDEERAKNDKIIKI